MVEMFSCLCTCTYILTGFIVTKCTLFLYSYKTELDAAGESLILMMEQSSKEVMGTTCIHMILLSCTSPRSSLDNEIYVHINCEYANCKILEMLSPNDISFTLVQTSN